jgi:DNA mismatch repair protein MutS2
VAALKNLDWTEILQHLEKFATSEVVRAKLREIKPLSSQFEAQESFNDIGEAQILLSAGERPFMESLDLYPNWHPRIKRSAVLQTLDLKDVRRFCLECIALSEVIGNQSGPWVNKVKIQLMDATEALSAIDQIMAPSGEIRTDASEALYNLYHEKSTQVKNLQSTLDRIVKKNDMESILQERFVTTREGRWVLPVKGGMQHAFGGIIHASSQSKQTVFMEPEEVIPLNNRLRQIDVDIEHEIERLLTSLSEYLTTQLMGFEQSYEALALADFKFAQAKLGEQIDASICKFSDRKLHLIDVRHPLLALKGGDVVSNSVCLQNNERILLLSGPNAGGKTVLLKAVGLACYMASCGLPICAAPESVIPFFKSMTIGIGDSQSVDEHLSTFAAHLKILGQASNMRGHENLLLIDEICGSTDPEEGSALARSFIEKYASNQVFAVITSHLGPLKVGWKQGDGVINGSLEYDAQSGLPTYKFFMGVPGRSLALLTARRVGVNEKILDRALELLSPDAKLEHSYLRDIESLKDDLQRRQKDLEVESRSARETKRTYQSLIQKFRSEKDEWLSRIVKKAEKKIDILIDQSQADQVFKRHEKLSQIKSEMPEIVKASAPQARKKIESPEEFEKAYPPGSMVHVTSLGQEAVVQGRANGKGEIPVLSNSMRLMVHWSQLKSPQNLSNPTSQILRRHVSNINIGLQDAERTLDVRGLRVDEAIGQLEVQLDAASLAGEDRIKIVHGHGTEALKKAVRSHLSRSIYVKKWKASPQEIGGDGITWAELKD